MIIPIIELIVLLETTIDRRYYYYEYCVDFNKEAVIVKLGRKRSPFHTVEEEFPFDLEIYSTKGFINDCIKEMQRDLKDKGW